MKSSKDTQAKNTAMRSDKLIPSTAKPTWLYESLSASQRVAHPVQVLWAYPAPESVSFSALGYLLLYKTLDTCPYSEVERIAQDTVKTHTTPLRTYDWLGFSIAWELDCFTLLDMLETLGLPWRASERQARREAGEAIPLLFAGGPVITSNPEPYALWFDALFIGDGEELFPEVMQFTHAHAGLNQTDSPRFLRQLAQAVEGVYVPSAYTPLYDGEALRGIAHDPAVPARVHKRQTDLQASSTAIVTSPVLYPDTVFSDTFLIEVMRGCAHRCRFCLASYSVLPARGPSLDSLIEAVQTGLKHTRKLGLLGALIADHPEFEALCDYLLQQEDVTISSASLRADTLKPKTVQTFAHGKQKQLTIAVESGSAWLRRRINKHLSQEAILQAAETTYANGIKGLKLYGMVGLPDETPEHVDELADLMHTLHKQSPQLRLTLGCSSFVPKAATPFQWQARLETSELKRRMDRLHKRLKGRVEFHPSSPRWDYLQALLSRGDRRITPLLEAMVRLGGQPGHVRQAWKALKASGWHDTQGMAIPDPDWYVTRTYSPEEVLPWDMIFLGVEKAILYKEGLIPPALHQSQ
ncbi:MAG: radical SAM protein [Vampirovibrionales bacterium]